jgi:glycosyltransferase involved in cell wall biosynthesis
MNILILSWRGPGHPSAGGAEQSTWHHARGWAKAGHTVTLLTAAYQGSKRYENKDGVQVIRFGDQFIGVRLAAFFWYWFGKHKTLDLVVDEFHGIPFFTPVWAFRSKVLGFIHEVAQPVWMLNPWSWPFNLIPAFVGRYGEPWMFKLLYRNIPFMTVSQSTKKDLEKFGVKNVTVVHNGVTLLSGAIKFPKEKNFTIIYLSAIARDKGIDDALKAFSIIKTKIPEAVFWVAGKGNPDHIESLKNNQPPTLVNRREK